MQRTDVEELQRVHASPAVSILMPTRRALPGNAEDPIRLRDLVADATRRLVETVGAAGADPIIARLDRAVGQVDLDHPGEGIAIFVTHDQSRVFTLEFPVREQVTLDETFATRDLVLGLARRPRYRVLALAEKPSRLFDGTADHLAERHDGGFPLAIEGAHGEPLPSGGRAPHTSRGNEELRRYFRQVDRAFGAVVREPLPTVIVGTERDLAYFDEVTRHGDRVIGRVHGNHALTVATDLARLVWPIVEQHLAEQRAAAVDRLVEAIGARRAAVGIEDVWTRAGEGRGHLLLVEDGDREAPRRVADGRLVPAGDADAPGVLTDPVDEVIETVLTRGGDVMFVDADQLGEHGPIAMILRW